ncbi:MAG: hypothetical protein SH848_02875 [Saprospiraceae bacterium]|nr:hypothetical protein [Saprospiraceae bacterium]MDZ4702844.1 hypothetical protein [Saprospiraceae bacterium]
MRQAEKNIHPRSEHKQPACSRQLLAASLLLILLVHPQAWNSWALMLRAKIQYEVRERFEEKSHENQASTTLLKIPLTWVKKGHPQLIWTEDDEFRYYGEMYDILDQEPCGDTIWYTCYHDIAETVLLNGLFEKMQARHAPFSSGGGRFVFAALFDKWRLNDNALISFDFTITKQEPNDDDQNLSDRACDGPPFPPPRDKFSFL